MSFRDHIRNQVLQGFATTQPINIPAVNGVIVPDLGFLDTNGDNVTNVTKESVNTDDGYVAQEIILYADYFKNHSPDTVNELIVLNVLFECAERSE